MGFGDASEQLVNANEISGSTFDTDENQAIDVEAGGLNVDLSGLTGVLRVAGGVGYANASTSHVPEGTNLYHTNVRVSANPDVAANVIHAALTSGNPHTVTAAELSLGTADSPKFAGLDIGDDSTPGLLTVFGTDQSYAAGILVPEQGSTYACLVTTSGLEGLTVDAAGVPSAWDEGIYIQYYSSGNTTIGNGGGDLIVKNNLSIGDGKWFGLSATDCYLQFDLGSGVPNTLTLIDCDYICDTAIIGGVEQPALHTALKDPTGFLDRVATLSWDDPSYTLTITGSHDIYIDGVKTTKGTDSIQIADTTGVHWIYYNSAGTLSSALSFPGFDEVLLAHVYWNTDGNGGAYNKGLASDERHGISMPWATHQLIHETIGCRWESGLAGTFDNTTLSIATGEWHDDDLEHTVASPETTCNVLYKNGSADWEWDAAASVYYKLNGANLRYNNGNALADAGNNQYMAMWIFITADITTPIIALMGQRVDTTLAAARANNVFGDLSLGDLPFAEMKLLYRVIIRNTGTPPTWTENQDLRTSTSLPSGNYVATEHGSLTGLSDDDHTQYLLADGSRALADLNLTSGAINVGGVQMLKVDSANTNVLVGTNVFLDDEGSANVGVGYHAGENASSSTGNVFVGYISGQGAGAGMTGSANTGVGAHSIKVLTSGYENVAVGALALAALTSGYYNTAVGRRALEAATLGHDNAAIGFNSLADVIDGDFNLGFGSNTLFKITDGNSNLAMGANALYDLNGVAQSNNIAIGNNAASNITTGESNVVIGPNAFATPTGGSRNIIVGLMAAFRQTGTVNDMLMVDNRQRATAAAELTDALIVGHMDATPAAQWLAVHGLLTVSDGLGITGTAYFNAEIDNGNSGNADTIDWTAGNKQKSTLTDDCTFTFSPEPAGPCNLVLKLIHAVTGGALVTWPADVNWSENTEPTLSVELGAVDIISFYYDGSEFHGQAMLDSRNA